MDIFQKKGKKLNILFVSSEAAPFAQVGGLGDVMYALPKAISALGHDVRVMIPRYGTIDPGAHNLQMEYEGLEVPTAPEQGGKQLICNVRRYEPNGKSQSPVTTYFLENQEYYELRSNIYGYSDDRIRFALLSRGALEFLNRLRSWSPDIIVATDWMAGLLPNFLATEYKNYRRLQHIATVFSIHNLPAQGTARPSKFIPDSERDGGHEPIPDFFTPRLDNINAMRRGIMYADVINTVSPRYAQEIMTPEFGEGLDGLLREKRDRVFGILNGIDYEISNPMTEQTLAKTFSAKTLDERDENKLALQKRFGLPQDKGIFVAGVVSRLTRQKGFGLFPTIMDAFLKSTKGQLVVLGTGDTEIMTYFSDLEKKFPEQVRAHLQFDPMLPHTIFAGSDVILVPSYFEPSGLTQMEAMRYGAIPVARRVGGLADTIEDYDPKTKKGTGFLFDDFQPTDFLITLIHSFVNWRHQDAWRKLQKNAMEKDFSWPRSAKEYVKLFLTAKELHTKTSEAEPAASALVYHEVKKPNKDKIDLVP